MSLAALIVSQRAEHGIPHATACRALGVSESWFYKWRDGDCSVRRARRAVLAAAARFVFVQHRGRYGSPRLAAELREAGWRVSENTVAELMREQGLVARRRRRRRGWTKASASARKAPDLLGRDFSLRDGPDEAWVGDLTEIPNDQGPLFLATILDLHSRRVVGFALSEHHDAELARAALCVAIAVRGGDIAGVIFHTDQGGEYTGELFAEACRQAGVRQSMGRTGSALDNAPAESLNSTIEFELLREQHFTTRAQARRAVASWIEEYNTDRRHTSIGMIAPVAYEQAQVRELAEAA